MGLPAEIFKQQHLFTEEIKNKIEDYYFVENYYKDAVADLINTLRLKDLVVGVHLNGSLFVNTDELKICKKEILNKIQLNKFNKIVIECVSEMDSDYEEDDEEFDEEYYSNEYLLSPSDFLLVWLQQKICNLIVDELN